MAIVLILIGSFLGTAFASLQLVLGFGGVLDAFQSYRILAFGVPVLAIVMKLIEASLGKTPASAQMSITQAA